MTKGLKLIIATLIGSALVLAVLIHWHTNYKHNVAELRFDAKEEIAGPLTAEEQKVKNPNITNHMNPTAIITTNMGTIELELFEDQMPVTVGNFVALADSGFYNSTKFHRVIEGFMIQGGDPNSKGSDESIYGTGGPAKNVPDEFVEGELLTNTRGTIAMANTGQPNSGGSQWFINLVDNTNLDFDKPPFTSKHPVFGRVTRGMDIVDAIGAVETKAGDIPVSPVIVESIKVE
jgi:peptidylprolyl isomerase